MNENLRTAKKFQFNFLISKRVSNIRVKRQGIGYTRMWITTEGLQGIRVKRQGNGYTRMWITTEGLQGIRVKRQDNGYTRMWITTEGLQGIRVKRQDIKANTLMWQTTDTPVLVWEARTNVRKETCLADDKHINLHGQRNISHIQLAIIATTWNKFVS
jgi:hypothetical protein